jgi:hypothetical protein
VRLRQFSVVLLLLIACREEAPAPAPEARPAVPSPIEEERGNLLNIGYGAAVVSRTGELTLDHSALRAIDGDPASHWSSPPSDPQQTLLFSLAAPARVDQIGLQIPQRPTITTRALRVETSADGVNFVPVKNVQPTPTDQIQWFGASVPSVRYLKVSVIEGGSTYASLQSIHVKGEWLQPPAVAPIEDCWSVNEMKGSFAERDGRVAGWLDSEPDKTQLDGGRLGAVYRFAWARGPQWGVALVTLSPDGTRLSGLKWHEVVGSVSFGGSWFGERRTCRASGMQPDLVVDTFLRQAGWYPLFSLHFDDRDVLSEARSEGGLRIIENILMGLPSQRCRIIAREHHEDTPEANRRRAETRLRTLRDVLTKRGLDLTRVEFAPVGADEPPDVMPEAMRLLKGVVVIQIAGDGRSTF